MVVLPASAGPFTRAIVESRCSCERQQVAVKAVVMILPDANSGGESEADEPEVMRYGMLGEDDGNVDDKLAKYTGEVGWEYLKKPYEIGAVLFVDPSLDLAEVGRAFTEDKTESVLAWKGNGDIIQPGPAHAQYWEAENAKFLALVVTPFVLIQPVAVDC